MCVCIGVSYLRAGQFWTAAGFPVTSRGLRRELGSDSDLRAAAWGFPALRVCHDKGNNFLDCKRPPADFGEYERSRDPTGWSARGKRTQGPELAQ